jgi:hypothetical protein
VYSFKGKEKNLEEEEKRFFFSSSSSTLPPYNIYLCKDSPLSQLFFFNQPVRLHISIDHLILFISFFSSYFTRGDSSFRNNNKNKTQAMNRVVVGSHFFQFNSFYSTKIESVMQRWKTKEERTIFEGFLCSSISQAIDWIFILE